ncbi:hypothetical protein DRO38_03595 [Candidatus Bathyarchaeota archaeon]|nr:MAG: hypothetical protein DRO38_03595 [Candidatus Bathyarchaeota archaeon]
MEYTQEQKDMLKLAQERHSQALGFFRTYNQTRFQRYLSNYNNDGQKRLKEKLAKNGGQEWMSNIFDPLTSSYIDSIIPIVKENMPQPAVRPSKAKAIEYSKDINSYLAGYWVNKAQLNSVLGELSKSATIFGVSYPLIRWEVAYDMLFTYEGGDGDKVSGELDEDSYIETNDPIIESCDVFNTFPDGFATNAKTRRFVSIRRLLTKEEAMQKYRIIFDSNYYGEDEGKTKESLDAEYKDIFDSIKVGTGDLTDYSGVRYTNLLKTPERNMGGDNSPTVNSTGSSVDSTALQTKGLSEFIEVHTAQDITVYCGNRLIGKMKNLCKELQVGHLCYKKPEWGIWGIGIAEELDIAQYYINVAINQESDVATLENFPMYSYDPSEAGLGMGADMVVSPSRMIPIAPNSVKPLARGGTLNLSYKLIEYLRVAAREAVGIDETTRGSQLPSSTVATQINAIRESTNRRINNFLGLIAEYERDMIRQVLKLGYLLYPTKDIEEETGEMYQEINPLTGEIIEIPEVEKVEYIDLDIPSGDTDDETFFDIKKEAFSPRGLYRFTPKMIKSIEFSRQASIRDSLDFMAELNRILSNDVAAKSLANLDLEGMLKGMFEKFGVEYKVTEGAESPQDIKAMDEAMKLAGGAQGGGAPNAMSQLPEQMAMSPGQNLSRTNQ